MHLITARQMAERYGVAHSTAWGWSNTKGFPKPKKAIKGGTGTIRYYNRMVVDRWYAQNKQNSIQQAVTLKPSIKTSSTPSNTLADAAQTHSPLAKKIQVISFLLAKDEDMADGVLRQLLSVEQNFDSLLSQVNL